MNNFLNNINVNDALTVWDGVKESMKAVAHRPKESSGLDYSFITPTLLALGKFSEPKIDEFTRTLQGSPVLLWNLSGKQFSPNVKSSLMLQIMDAPWVTPGQFTQAPSLECIFAQCYSIKAWLDLSSDHVAVIHCSNGRSRTGILIACFLKHIGAFEHASHAFDFFCSARSLSDVKPSLAPSYRILFENVDRAVDHGGYPNRKALHLKCLAISGLPVDEIPCVEVWDMNGIVFNSHQGWKSTNKCTWSSEYGDGFFRVSHDILGDFSVMCRFGGHHAMTRDKTTLIFKYQNSTAFLPCEVVELKRQNVDVNPEYSESLDTELFTVHLMFEKATGNGSTAAPDGHRVAGALLAARHTNGKDAFESGLDEISKHHAVEPDPAKSGTLIDMGFGENYATVALQLANNSLDLAAELIQCMKTRSLELEDEEFGARYDAAGGYLSQSTSGMSLAGLSDGSGAHANVCANGAAEAVLTESDPAFADVDSDDDSDGEGEAITGPGRGGGKGGAGVSAPSLCAVCNEDNIVKRDQLIYCTACRNAYHTSCFGARRIPFSLKTMKERANREKYVNKHYGSWRCDSCVKSDKPSVSGQSPVQTGSYPTSNVSFTSGSRRRVDDSSRMSAAEISALKEMQSPASKSKHEQAALLMGLLAENGLSIDQLMAMGEEKQKEVLISAATMHNSRASKSGSASGGMAGSAGHSGGSGAPGMGGGPGASAAGAGAPGQQGSSTGALFGSIAAGAAAGSGSAGAGTPAAGDEGSKDPRAAMLAMMNARLGGGGGGAGPASGSGSGSAAAAAGSSASRGEVEVKPAGEGAAFDGPKLKDDPTFAKFIKMIKVGLPKASVAQKMFSEGAAPTLDDALKTLDMNPDGPVPVYNKAEEKKEAAAGDGEKVPVGEHPKYVKYFKMVSVGLPKEMVKAKMTQEGGVNPDYLDKDKSEMVLLDETKHVDQPAEDAAGGETVAVSEHPKYAKFFRMLKVGLPPHAVKSKMEQEGVDPSYLDKDPNEMIPVASSPMVEVAKHPKYEKFFKMLKVGLQKEAIAAKITQEGLNPAYIHKDPTELVPLDDGPPKEAKKSTPVKKVPKVRKKKLHWKALDASKIASDSLWAKDDDELGIKLDEEEFNELFVESTNPNAQKKPKEEEPKKKRIQIIDMKRAQNGGISLARIKVPFDEVRNKIASMDDEIFTTDQLRSLEEFLPTIEENAALAAYKGDQELLGAAERYMIVMKGFPTAQKRIECMIYKQMFKSRVHESKVILNTIEGACDDVKMCVRLKKVMKTILKVGNQMNDGEENAGFTLDSLLKLQSAKAFDKKTSILQYVIMLIYRNDENCLNFPDDLTHVSEASRVTLDSVSTEAAQLRQGLDSACAVVTNIRGDDGKAPNSTGSMATFLVKATQKCDELDQAIEKVKNKFLSVLAYFGEDPGMAPHEFFNTLSKFVLEFTSTRDKVERIRKLEERNRQAKETRARRQTIVAQAKGPADGGSEKGKPEAVGPAVLKSRKDRAKSMSAPRSPKMGEENEENGSTSVAAAALLLKGGAGGKVLAAEKDKFDDRAPIKRKIPQKRGSLDI